MGQQANRPCFFGAAIKVTVGQPGGKITALQPGIGIAALAQLELNDVVLRVQFNPNPDCTDQAAIFVLNTADDIQQLAIFQLNDSLGGSIELFYFDSSQNQNVDITIFVLFDFGIDKWRVQ